METPWFLYHVTQGYTVGKGGNHDGWDFGAPSHTPLRSLTGGSVTKHTGWYPWGGEVDIKGGLLGGGITETFAHADRIDVKPGDRIVPGQQVGLSGGEGLPLQYSNGPHIHYSLFGGAPWDNKQSIDPSKFLGDNIKNWGVGTAGGSTGLDPGAAVAAAIGEAYGKAEFALGSMVKRAGYFVLGLGLILAGLVVLMVAVARKEAQVAAPYVKEAAKIAAFV